MAGIVGRQNLNTMPIGVYDHSHLIKPLRVRFDEKWVKEESARGCWIWTASKSPLGYGYIQTGTNRAPNCCFAHRVSWELHHGEIPVGLFVLHKCDNPACVNPDHLFLGDQTANMRDMSAKGRSGQILHPEIVVRGEDHPCSKLTDDSVRSIRAMIKSGVPVRQVARIIGVNRRTITFVRDGKTWRHVQ